MDATQLLAQASDVVAAADPAGLEPARQQMALSLGWHIILACFGVAFPAIIFVMHLRGIRKNDRPTFGLDLAVRERVRRAATPHTPP